MKHLDMYPDEQRYRLAAVTRTMFAGSVGSRQAQTILERLEVAVGPDPTFYR
jgi:hypothetical protein